jgi:hypothetical protein
LRSPNHFAISSNDLGEIDCSFTEINSNLSSDEISSISSSGVASKINTVLESKRGGISGHFDMEVKKMIRQLKLCIIVVTTGIVMMSAQVSEAWQYSRGCGCSSAYGGSSYGSFQGGYSGNHFRHRPSNYRQYSGPSGHTAEYERMRDLYGVINF